jgi:hypothetical protein
MQMNDNQRIPSEVLAEIEEISKDSGGGDDDESRKVRDAEIAAYLRFRQLITANPDIPPKLVDCAREEFCWRGRTEYLEDELNVRDELIGKDFQGLPDAEITKIKKEAMETHPNSYTDQREFIDKIMKVETIKELLIHGEWLIGCNCYNGNIQNYRGRGELESIGRTFRYPVTFYNDGVPKKESYIPKGTGSLALLSGSYRFGANELRIFKGILALLEFIENRYQLDSTELERLREQ